MSNSGCNSIKGNICWLDPWNEGCLREVTDSPLKLPGWNWALFLLLLLSSKKKKHQLNACYLSARHWCWGLTWHWPCPEIAGRPWGWETRETASSVIAVSRPWPSRANLNSALLAWVTFLLCQGHAAKSSWTLSYWHAAYFKYHMDFSIFALLQNPVGYFISRQNFQEVSTPQTWLDFLFAIAMSLLIFQCTRCGFLKWPVRSIISF